MVEEFDGGKPLGCHQHGSTELLLESRRKVFTKQVVGKGTKNLDGGVLFTQFSHFVDIMYWLFGDIQNNCGHEYQLQPQRGALSSTTQDWFNLSLVNGGFGSINYSTAIFDTNFESSIVVVG